MLSRWRRLLPSVSTKRPSSQTYQIGVTWAQPSSRFVANRPMRARQECVALLVVSTFSRVAVVRFRALLGVSQSSTIAAARTGEP